MHCLLFKNSGTTECLTLQRTLLFIVTLVPKNKLNKLYNSVILCIPQDDTPCCSLVILPSNRTEEDYLRNIYGRVTAPSPVWKESISIEPFRNTTTSIGGSRQHAKHAHTLPRCEASANLNNKTPTQSLSVNFILREELIGNEVHKIRRLFFKKPWRFHHSFQTYDMEKQKVVAKQPYYELTDEYPLMSPSVCHHGSSVLRYNIFVKDNFQDMKYFYMDLLRSQPMYEEENFCYFTIFSKNGTEIQLSLKHSKQLHIIPTKRTFLKLNIDNVYEAVHEMGAKIEEIFCSDCGVLVTRDPDGNPILISGKSNTNAKNSTKMTSPLKRDVTQSQRKDVSRKSYQEDDVWSDCSSCCEQCIRDEQTFNNTTNNNNNNYSNKRTSHYCYQTDQNDSGYHNDDGDDVSSSDDDERMASLKRGGVATTSRPRAVAPGCNCSNGVTQLHFPSCRNKGCCDRYGRPFTCCVVNV